MTRFITCCVVMVAGGSPIADISTGLPPGESMPLLPETRARMKAQLAKDDPQANCLPLPAPRFTPYPWRVVVTPTHALHVVERYTRTSLGTMAGQITVNDPGAYSRPFTIAFTARLMANHELMEYVCDENNQDLPYLVGPADTRGR